MSLDSIKSSNLPEMVCLSKVVFIEFIFKLIVLVST